MAKKKDKEQDLSVEDSLSRLGEIVDQLESDETTLAEAIELFKEGHALASACRKKLVAAELTVTELVSEVNDNP